MQYDDADRLSRSLEKVTDGSAVDELETLFEYDADDNLTMLTGPGAEAPEVTSRVFDGRGLPWKITAGTGDAARRRVVEYDPNGNLRRLVNPLGINASGEARVPDNLADDNDNLVDASENATLLRYDEDDLLVVRRLPWNGDDERKFRTKFVRNDPLSRIRSILSAHEVTDEGQVDDNKVPRTSYDYFDTDWIASISDQKLSDPTSDVIFENRLVEFDYDVRGAQTEWRSKNAGESSAGRHIVREFWPNGRLQNRTAEKTTSDAAQTSRTYRYFYNRNESLSAFKDERNDRLTTIRRDPVERQSEVNETWANGKDSRFDYDVAGNVTTRQTDGKIQGDGSFGGDDRKVTTFDYDSLDREFEMTVDPMVGADRETVTNYWPSGRKQSRRKPNGTSDRWFYDTRGMVTRHERVRAGQNDPEDDDVDYRYDENGNRDRDERGTYRFNARDQLTKWTNANGRVTDYVLNGDGQITSKTVDPPDAPSVTTTYKYRGERLRWTETDDVRAYYRYDDFGNVVRIIQKSKLPNGQFPEVNDNAPQASGCEEVPTNVEDDETYYCYDEFERLRLAKGAGVTEKPQRIDYDGLDRRDTRTFQDGTATKTRDYSYIGTSELLSREVELDGDKHFYDYDSVGERVGQQVSGSTSRYRAYLKDANGSVLGLEADDGTIAGGARYEYDPYGELENPGALNTDAQENPFRFEGFYYDSGVKSYDMYARAYRPESGRFLTQDRLASASQDLLLQSDPLTQNRYAFAGGNPVNAVEFDGHEPPTSYNPNARQKMKDEHGNCFRDCDESFWEGRDVSPPPVQGTNTYAPWSERRAVPTPKAARGAPETATGSGYRGKPGVKIDPLSERCMPNYQIGVTHAAGCAGGWSGYGGIDPHLILDFFGHVPVAGEAFDLGNCLWYGAEGRETDATLACASAVPGLGYGADAGKLVNRTTREIAGESAEQTARHSDVAAKGGSSIVKYDADFAIGQLTSRGAKASDLARLAESQGWRRVQNPNGPIKYLDEAGVPRLTLKSGSARAPGSNFPHVEIRNAAGRRVDPYGNPVTRKSPGNHTRIDWDLR